MPNFKNLTPSAPLFWMSSPLVENCELWRSSIHPLTSIGFDRNSTTFQMVWLLKYCIKFYEIFRASARVLAKLHGNCVRIEWEISKKLSTLVEVDYNYKGWWRPFWILGSSGVMPPIFKNHLLKYWCPVWVNHESNEKLSRPLYFYGPIGQILD